VNLELSERILDGHAVVELRGELDLTTTEMLRERLLAVLTEKSARLILDLSGLTFMDSTGISVLVATERRAFALGGSLSLAGLQKVVARVLHITSLDRHFPIFATVGDAVQAGREAGPDARPQTGCEADLGTGCGADREAGYEAEREAEPPVAAG
jgi:anti-sigma B factor antagonist